MSPLWPCPLKDMSLRVLLQKGCVCVSKLLGLGEQAITPQLFKQLSASLCLSFPLAEGGFLCNWEKSWEAGANPRHPPGPSPPVIGTRQGAHLCPSCPPLGGVLPQDPGDGASSHIRAGGITHTPSPLQPCEELGHDKASCCAPAAPARRDGAPPPPAPLFGAKSKGFFCP